MEYRMSDDDDVFASHFPPRQNKVLLNTNSTDNTKFAVMLTVFCIVVIHYRASIAAWLASWGDTRLGVYVSALLEMFRVLTPGAYMEEEEEGGEATATMTRRQRRALLAAMPKLEHYENKNDSLQATTATQQRRRQRNTCELEPAFLSDKDYPAGWMVYDAESRSVMTKVQADKLQEERRKCKENAASSLTADSSPVKPKCPSKEDTAKQADDTKPQTVKQEPLVQVKQESVQEEEKKCSANELKAPAPQSPVIEAT